MRDWIPSKLFNLLVLCVKWITALSSDGARADFRWDGDLCVDAITAIEPFVEAAAAYKEDDSSRNRAVLNETRPKAVKAMRTFATTSIRHNPYMTDADRLEMGLRKPDTVPTPHLRPSSRPTMAVERTLNYFEHRVKALNVETGKADKPADAYGLRFVWQAGGERPATGADILRGRFSRRPVITVTYDETDRGKIAYYAACYENAKGEAGAWSPIVEAYIG